MKYLVLIYLSLLAVQGHASSGKLFTLEGVDTKGEACSLYVDEVGEKATAKGKVFFAKVRTTFHKGLPFELAYVMRPTPIRTIWWNSLRSHRGMLKVRLDQRPSEQALADAKEYVVSRIGSKTPDGKPSRTSQICRDLRLVLE